MSSMPMTDLARVAESALAELQHHLRAAVDFSGRRAPADPETIARARDRATAALAMLPEDEREAVIRRVTLLASVGAS
jgi:hypothetical protein